MSSTKSAKYFGIVFNSTPDISHTDQMSDVISYVKIIKNIKKVDVKEVLLGFFPLKGGKAAGISADILKKRESDGLDIMAGIHGGVQAIIKDKKTIFNECVDHSLNLCSQHSFAETASCVTFLWNS